MNNITMAVTGRKVSVTAGTVPLVAGSQGVDALTATFDSEWDGLDKYVNFAGTAQRGAQAITCEYEDGMLIPWEALAQRGALYVSFSGRNGDGEILRTETMAPLPVEGSSPRDGIEPTPPTLDVIAAAVSAAESALTAAQAASAAATDIYAAAARGDFDGAPGAPGQPGQQGEQGADGVSPQASVERVEGGAEITITDADGTTTAIVYDGQGGGEGASDFELLSNRPNYNGAAMTHSTNIPEVKTDTWDAKYDKPSEGIPKSDLASTVQSSLDRADSALQSHQSLAAYRTSAEQDAIDAAIIGATIFKITCTETGGVKSFDKTYANITGALTSGQLPVVTFDGRRYVFGNMEFSKYWFYSIETNQNKVHNLNIDSSNVVSGGTLTTVAQGHGHSQSDVSGLDTALSGKLDASKVAHETWTFTLDDDSTVTKEVMLWVG